jgi:hypothetical protein
MSDREYLGESESLVIITDGALFEAVETARRTRLLGRNLYLWLSTVFTSLREN